MLEIFANAIKDRQNQLAKSKTVQPPDVHDNTSRDLFDDDDDEIVPETQEVLTQEVNSEDSGESVRIPFYDKKNTCDSESSSKDSDNESEYIRVRPESNQIVVDEPQSQFLMANIDRSLFHELEISTATTQKTNTSDSDDSTLTTEGNLAKQNTQTKENSEKHCDNRSGSTTPDLDFLDDLTGQGNNKEPDAIQTNGKSDKNQQNSESIFEKCTQQFCLAEASANDIFTVPTQPVFKHPAAASSTPYAKNRTKAKPVDESIYDADTQLAQDEEEEEDIFDLATQLFTSQKPSSTAKSNKNQQIDNHVSKPNGRAEHDTSGNCLLFIIKWKFIDHSEWSTIKFIFNSQTIYSKRKLNRLEYQNQ